MEEEICFIMYHLQERTLEGIIDNLSNYAYSRNFSGEQKIILNKWADIAYKERYGDEDFIDRSQTGFKDG